MDSIAEERIAGAPADPRGPDAIDAGPGTTATGAHKRPYALRDWRGVLVAVPGIGAAVAGFVAAYGAGWALWDWRAGLAVVEWSFAVALAALVIAVLVIATGRRAGRATRWPLLLLGGLVAAGYAVYLASWWFSAQSLPAIHDISTDLADPPAFTALPLRADNLDKVPGAGDSDMAGLNPRQRWALIHQRAYPDLRSVRIQTPPADLYAKAQRLVADRGWEAAGQNPGTGTIEATARATPFAFHDDMVLRIRPIDGGAASIVDMRGVRREGQHDFGENAARIRTFLADLSGTTSTAAR